ncbi:hypothetical protein Tco_1042154 [Tanacetum coccineum]|uniref:Uncharacterized protein n=1 Tax=Tanacetum coccineum TaxID=301880 RepID=A0ABQ5GIY4_9ASTR
MGSGTNDVRRTIIRRLRQELVADVALANNLLNVLTRLEQMCSHGPKMLRVESLPDHPLIKCILRCGVEMMWHPVGEKEEMLRVESLPDHPLIKYGFNTLERAMSADMTNSSNLVATRNELLRTIAEKEEMINHHRTM